VQLLAQAVRSSAHFVAMRPRLLTSLAFQPSSETLFSSMKALRKVAFDTLGRRLLAATGQAGVNQLG
jgi:hypothetical protein